jgi:hypothetical protein
MASLLQLKQAGYSDEEIALWVDEKRKTWNQAGYTHKEQSDELGIPFKSLNKYMDTSLIGGDAKKFNLNNKNKNEKLTIEEEKEIEDKETEATDELTKAKLQVDTEEYSKYLEKQAKLSSLHNEWMPYEYANKLEYEAFRNRNKLNLNKNQKIYDEKGLPINPKYHSEFSLEEPMVTSTGGHTINALNSILNNNKLSEEEQGAGIMLMDHSLRHYAKVLSGNDAYGARSYNWGDGTYGAFRMNDEEIQSGINYYLDTLKQNGQPIPYWIEELALDKDNSGLPRDAQVALFLSYLMNKPKFNRDFNKLISNENTMEDQMLAVRDLLFNNYLIGKKLEKGQFDVLLNRLNDNLNKHWFEVDKKTTSMQVPAFGTWMPDIVSQSGDHLMGEGRNSSAMRGWSQSVTSMAYRLYNDLKEMKDTGANPMDVRKLLDEFMTGGQRWDKRAIAGITSVISDLGIYGAGSLPYLKAGPVLAMGGAFGLHEALRWALIEAYTSNELGTFESFWDLVMTKAFAKHYGRGFTTGALTAVGGQIGGKATGLALSKTPFANTVVGNTVKSGSALAGEVAVLGSMPSVWNYVDEGKWTPPNKQEFMDAAIILFGLKSGMRGFNYSSQKVKNGVFKLYKIYAQTGKTPKEVLKDAERNPSIIDDLENVNKIIPDEYADTSQSINKIISELKQDKKSEHQSIPAPKFTVGERVNGSSTGIEKAEIVNISFKDGKHIYQVKTEDGKIINLPEESVAKYIPKKIVQIFKEPEPFYIKQSKGEYDAKIEIIERDNQIFETTSHRTSQAFTPQYKTVGISKDGLAYSNRMMVWMKDQYPKLVKEAEQYYNKGKKLYHENFDLSMDALFAKVLPKPLYEKPIKLLFKVNQGNKLGIERPVIVGDVNGKIFSFDLHSYMALKKLADGSDAKVTAHLHKSERGTNRSVLIFRDNKGKTTAVLASRSDSAKVEFEATKFKNEFGTEGKVFADVAQPTSTGGRGFPKWEDLNVDKSTNVFRGLELMDLIKMFKDLSENDVVAKLPRYRPSMGGRPLGLFYPVGKGKIVLNKQLFENILGRKDYKTQLEDIMMTMAHELGHYIDYIPQNIITGRGNILGRIASLINYGKHWIAGKEGGEGPIPESVKAQLVKEANKIAKSNLKNTNKEIEKDLGIKPEDILKIITDAKAREFLPPAIYEGFAKVSSELKKAIIKDAMKGLVNPAMLKIVSGKTKDAPNALKAEADKIFSDLFQKEVLRRGLVGRDQVMFELKALTQRWKPFNDKMNEKFTKYRYSPEELMADFMMSFLLKPKETSRAAPIAYTMWTRYIHRKPELKKLYEELQLELNLPRDKIVANRIREKVQASMEAGMKLQEKAAKELDDIEPYDVTRRNFDQHNYTLINYFKKTHGDTGWWSSPKSKKRFEIPEKDNPEIQSERFEYNDTLIEGIQNRLYKDFWFPLEEAGLNRHLFASYLQSRWISNPEGTRANVLNPRGEERIAAQEIVNWYESKYPEITNLAEKFYKFREDHIIPLFEQLGMSPEILAIAKNNREYVTFSVEEYAKMFNDSWALGYVKATKYGTSKDVMNVLDATILKDWALIQVLSRHNMIATNIRYLKQDKEQIENLNRTKVKSGFYGTKFLKFEKIKERIYEPAKKNVVEKDGVVTIVGWRPVDKDFNTKGYELVNWIENGKMQGAYIGKEIADYLNATHNMKFMQDLNRIAYGINLPYRKLFTEMNPPFWGYNVFRDVFRTLQNIPDASLWDINNPKRAWLGLVGENSFVRLWIKSVPDSYKSIFDPRNIPEFVQTMLMNREMLSVWDKYRNMAQGSKDGQPTWANTSDGVVRVFFTAAKHFKNKKPTRQELETFVESIKDKKITEYTREEIEIEKSLRDGAIDMFEQRFQRDKWLGSKKSGFLIGENSWIQPLYKTITSTEMMARVWERTTKIAAKKSMLNSRKRGRIDWTDAQIEYAVRNWAGSPNFLRKGKQAWLYNNILLYGNVAKEQNRSVIEAKRWHKEYKIPFSDKFFAGGVGVHASWYGKLFMYGVSTKIINYGAKAGLMGYAAHAYYNLIGNHALSNYTIIPLGHIRDDGSLVWGMENVDKNNPTIRAVYLQLPVDEFQKLIGTLTFHSLEEHFGKIMDDPAYNLTENILRSGVGVLDENTPSLTPFIPLLWNAVKATGIGKNPPQDFFTGQDLYPEYVQNAAGWEGFSARYKAFSKYMWNNAGGLMFYKFDTYYQIGNQDNIVNEIENVLKFPIFGKTLARFVKVSDNGMKQTVWEKVNQVNINKATASVIIDKALNRMIEEDGRLDMSKLTPREQQAMLIDTGWIDRYNAALEVALGKSWTIRANSLDGKALQKFVSETLRLQNEFNYNFDSKKK